MTATLTAAITDHQTVIAITNAPALRLGSLLQIEDELVGVYGPHPAGGWEIVRGRQGTTAASHDQGITVTAVVPVSGPDAIEGAGVTPTLTDVLAAGHSVSPVGVIQSADVDPDAGPFGATLGMTDASGTQGGTMEVFGGDGDAGGLGASFLAPGGNHDSHGRAGIGTAGSSGNDGDVLTADGAGGATWQAPDSFWEYDFDIDGGAQGTIPLRGAALDDKTFVNAAFVRVITPLTSDGSATVALTTGEADGDIDTVAAFDNAKYSAGFHAVVVHKFTTGSRVPAIVVAAADLTAGKIEVLLDNLEGWS